jgi:hypothetical protein
VVRPDPIPNSAVKHSLADGSSPIGSARVGRRQSFKKAGEHRSPAFLLCLNNLKADSNRWPARPFRCSPASNPFIFNDFCGLLVCQLLDLSGSQVGSNARSLCFFKTLLAKNQVHIFRLGDSVDFARAAGGPGN